MLPSTEARIAAQESLTAMLHAKIEYVAHDMHANFKEIRQDIKHLSEDMDASFKQNAEYQIEQERKIEMRFDKIEATLSGHGELLKEHGELLKEILARLPLKQD